MNFADRNYPAIVRDLLTALTGGTVREVHLVPADGVDLVHLDQRPVHRVSHLEGEIQVGEARRPYRFTERDFELVAAADNPDDFVALRFKRGGKRPAPDSTLVVNYYPLRTKPTPLNDVNVGSVTRTLLETVAREMATQYAQLQLVYESAFVDTAGGSSLDNVTALVDVQRLTRGHPVGKVRFSRRAGSPGSVFVPIHTAVSDGQGNRYLTSEEGRMQPNQSFLEVWVHGEAANTKTLEAGALSVVERAIAGVDRVANDEPTYRATDDESDAQLSARARRAIHGTGKGTLDAIRFALEGLPFVSGTSLVEYPDGVPGTLRVDIALSEDNEANRKLVARRVEEFRPAGIFVEVSYADRIDLVFEAALTLAGAFQPASIEAEVVDGVRERLADAVKNLAPGETLRKARLVSLVLQDDRLVDATLAIRIGGAPAERDTIQLPKGRVPRLDRQSDITLQLAYEQAPAAGSVLRVRADVQIGAHALADTLDVKAVEAQVRAALGPLLANLRPGATLSFTQVLQALGEHGDFVPDPTALVLGLYPETGAFTELSQTDPNYVVPPGASLELGKVSVTEVRP